MIDDPLKRNNVNLSGKADAAQTLVFVNGIGSDQSVWSAVAPAFQETHRLVTFDHVGSIPANFEYFRKNQARYLNASGYARDLLEICAALRLTHNVILVGHSLGAIACMLAAEQQSALFSRLILVGASPRYLDADGYVGGFSKAAVETIYRAIGTDYANWADAFASAAIGGHEISHARRLAESLARIPGDMMLTVLCSILQGDFRACLPKVRVPTTIIQSRQDYFVPVRVGEYLRAQIPDSQLNLIDAEGHFPHLTSPRILIEIMRESIAKSR